MSNDVKIDYVGGDVAHRLKANFGSPDALRPYISEDGFSYITNSVGQPMRLINNDAALTKDQWIYLDKVVQDTAKPRLKFVRDLISMGLVYNLPNAMGHTVLQFQNASDTSDATISMDGKRESDKDLPVFDIDNLPIPIIHKDIEISLREQLVSANGNGIMQASMAIEQASRKVSESAEKLHLGTYGTYKFGGGNVYGIRNHPNRMLDTYTDWAGSAKTGEDRLADILGFMQAMRDAYCYGPYGIYLGSNLAYLLDEDYKDESGLTLRQRILAVGNEGGEDNVIKFVRTLDYLTDNDIIVVQLAPESIRTIQGMQPRLLQWSTDGGLNLRFKVMSIMVPFLRPDYNNVLGVLHATKSS